MSLLKHKPDFNSDHVVSFVGQRYEIAIESVVALASERDQNFLVTLTNQQRFVFKISQSSETSDFLEAQNSLFSHVQPEIECCPSVLPSICENTIEPIQDKDGVVYLTRLVTFLPGRVLADLNYYSPELLFDFGKQLGRLNRNLESFDHKALHRDLHWDLANCQQVVGNRIEFVRDQALRDQINFFRTRYEKRVRPTLDELPKSIIHNDANDYNVVVDSEQNSPGHERISGIIDFGDSVYTHTINELAIAIAYSILDQPDPISVACQIIGGYHSQRNLLEAELDVLFGLIGMRMCSSIVIAAENLSQRPDDEYLSISQMPIERTLPLLKEIDYEFATACFRVECGFAAVKNSVRVQTWLGNNSDQFSFPVATDEPASFHVLNLGVDSPLLSQATWPLKEPELSELIVRELDLVSASSNVAGNESAPGTTIGIGQYLEPRLLYASDQFASKESENERRTIHLGIDLFIEANTEVRAVFDGEVYFVGAINRPLDYGTLVILRHRADNSNDEFFTLYGHLSSRSLEQVRTGQSVRTGEQIGWLGQPNENGGWPPHLHFQVMLDLWGYEHEFPGVGHPSKEQVWSSVSPDPNLILGLSKGLFPKQPPDKQLSRKRRGRLIGDGLSLGYREPLKIVRGIGSHLFDENGRQFIDAYNNVPHVGHCHPQVIEAAERQMRLLNTNTRYLNDLLMEYAERLSATMPDPLSVCYFLNSASEANELALRLARSFTGGKDLVVLEGAYHGNSTTLIDISPYKHDGPGGQGAPDWVHGVADADVYRGAYKDKSSAGKEYAALLEPILKRLENDNRQLCGFIAESCPSVGGQIIFPPNYLQSVYKKIRRAGGVCIADDVQTGYGRTGDAFYGYELQDVVPDVVVLGKPIGNGHPLAAVVTTREISKSFANGMEFFSTFGGNTVSCAIGLKVLEIVEQEGLQEHARKMGQLLLTEFEKLKSEFSIIGDVRGSGLFLGLELVRDHQTLEPAANEASFVINRMRDRGVLVGVDGPLHNVIKVRPPMVFSKSDAKQLVEALRRSLSEL